ncbi:putative metal-dependent hydrolase [Mesorhizobium metallidurans STM 2683]|uniref:Putative metal-dependent hydrolase n=1 Tax=Mesorhizobium metallidurans STM 2683 TaxID=1297569 RepID=M5EIX2_9HYPH|nr:amidohydrolase family protein [Mesorhizobium metallidurans]CCV04058.1 putative metal-dependent hydrolase [Mesorhizobium metallidurans STM 2683]
MTQEPRTLIRNAIVLSMDDSVGDFLDGDVLVVGDRIAAVGQNLQADQAEVIDGRGRIVIPGIVNGHMHTWQTALRGLTSNMTLLEYFRWVHRGLATAFRPEDIYIATLAGAIGQINAGATTLGDWCHNNPTSDHTDAAVEALFESGIRSVFLHGSPKPDPKPGQPHFSEVPLPRHEIERLLRGRFAGRDQLVTLGLAILGPHYSTMDVARADFRLARELGMVASMHQGGGEAKTPGGWERLEAEGLVGPGINVVHGNNLSDEQIRRFVGAGVSFTVTPENEMTQGHGFPITGRVLAAGGQPSFGVDIESLVSSDMFTVARMALACQRSLDNDLSRRTTGEIPGACMVSTRDALRWITLEGARMLGLDDRIGSLTPGKQADIAILRATDWNMWPVHDPYSTVIMQSNVGNVETVMIAGQSRKRDGKLLWDDAEGVKRDLEASGRRIVSQLGIPTQLNG